MKSYIPGGMCTRIKEKNLAGDRARRRDAPRRILYYVNEDRRMR